MLNNNCLFFRTEFIVLSTGGGSLGIHVVPDYNALGKERGLLVQGIEPGGRVHCDGRLQVYDRIVEINGRSLLDQPFNAYVSNSIYKKIKANINDIILQ